MGGGGRAGCPESGRSSWGRTSLSASPVGAGPEWPALARCSSRFQFDQVAGDPYTLARPPFWRCHGGRVPGLGRHGRPWFGQFQRPRAGGSPRGAPAGEMAGPPGRSDTGERPALAGSGSTWFVRASTRGGPPGCQSRNGAGLSRVCAGCCYPGGELSAGYLPARLCQRVAFSIFLCFFLRIRLRRFLINDPMAGC